MVILDKLFTILCKKNKKLAFYNWRKSLGLWKKKITSLKKLLQWNKMKLTSKVLNRWYSQFKYEESVMQSVCNRDYVISMYEILGNTQSTKQFENKYLTVFGFMVNRYLKQLLGKEVRAHLKKIVLVLKKEKSSFVMIDFTEEEKQKNTDKFVSPIKNKHIPEYISAIVSSKKA